MQPPSERSSSTITTTGDVADPTVVHALLERAAAVDGRYPLSDHLRLELAAGGGPGFAAITAADGDRLTGYAQVALINGTYNVELVVDPDHRDEPAIGRSLLGAAVDVVAARGGGLVQWWAFDATADDAELAASAGLAMTRELLQLRVDLPLDRPVDVATRPFEPGRDEDAFLAVNNRAFATHPEQGGWTRETLLQREHEPWFDPAGFLLHERDGRLAAFCWTKIHEASPTPGRAVGGSTGGGAPRVIGEIYVIAVDPDFQGLGLGNQLTLAGLASIAARGIDVGMLYVDGDNTAAVSMYVRLGFTRHRTDRAHTAVVPAAP